jgi:phosphoribosylformylglycinamidine cyclo-ligase
VRGIAHITGGGLQDNIARILPAGLGMEIRTSAWPVPALFSLIQRSGQVAAQDPRGKGMYETFNMGIGLVLVVDPARADSVTRALQAGGERVWTVGRAMESPRAAAAWERVRLVP